MDNYSSAGLGASSVVVMGILYKVYQAVNHKKFRSECCGKKFTASVDIDETTPKIVVNADKGASPVCDSGERKGRQEV
jgi:hypothetical protein